MARSAGTTTWTEIDKRGRVSLGQYLPKNVDIVSIEKLDDNSLMLRVADIVPRDDQALLDRPDILDIAKRDPAVDIDTLPAFPDPAQ